VLRCLLGAASIFGIAEAEPLLFDIAMATPGYDPRTNEPTVTFRLAPDSGHKFIEFMRQNGDRPIEMRVDAKVLSQPYYIAFPNGVLVSGHFSDQDAQDLAARLTEGTKLEIESPPN
jgi:preprotein translocase subunit SecD